MTAVLVAIVLSGGLPVDGGASPAGQAEVRVLNARFDGRELTGIALVCAEEGDVFVDARLDTAGTFNVRSIRTCEGRKELTFSVSDYTSGDIEPGAVRVRRGQCVGAPFVWRLFRLPLPSQSSCIEITVSARIRSAQGADVDRATTVLSIAP